MKGSHFGSAEAAEDSVDVFYRKWIAADPIKSSATNFLAWSDLCCFLFADLFRGCHGKNAPVYNKNELQVIIDA
jgi:hypothetical protein